MLVVRLSSWKVGLNLLLFCTLFALWFFVLVHDGPDVLSVLCTAFFGAIALTGFTFLAGELGRPRLVVDEDGVIAAGVPLTWDEIRWVRRIERKTYFRGIPMRFRSIAFDVKDPAVIEDRLPDGLGKRFWRRYRAVAGRIEVPFSLCDTSIDDALAAIERQRSVAGKCLDEHITGR